MRLYKAIAPQIGNWPNVAFIVAVVFGITWAVTNKYSKSPCRVTVLQNILDFPCGYLIRILAVFCQFQYVAISCQYQLQLVVLKQ